MFDEPELLSNLDITTFEVPTQLIAETPFLFENFGLLERVLIGHELPIQHAEVKANSFENDTIKVLVYSRCQVPNRLRVSGKKVCLFDLDGQLQQTLELQDHLFGHHDTLLSRVLHLLGITYADLYDLLNQA